MLEKKNVVIAIVGMPGAGKSAATEYLEQKYKFPVIYYGGYILERVRKKGLEINGENEKKVREELRTSEGMDVIAKLSLNDINDNLNKGQNVIIDGLYAFSEYMYLKKILNKRLFIIAVCANKQLRYDRMENRKFRPLTNEELDERDFAEIVVLEKGGPIAIADYTVLNNHSIQDFQNSIDNILEQIIAG